MNDVKKYKNSLVLGKFSPLTYGHIHVIDAALKYSENVYVIVYSFSNAIPNTIRFNWVKSYYAKNPNVRVLNIVEDLPQYPYENPNSFYDLWKNAIYNKIDKLDCIFASEDYVKPLADKLQIDSFMVDRYRKTLPISGTNIRQNPIKNWNFMPSSVQSYFTKRIAILGPNQCGKTTLSKNLAKAYDVEYVEDYGKLLYEFRLKKLDTKSFLDIINGRQILEDFKLTKKINKLLFCDTEDISTYIFSKNYHTDSYKDVEKKIINKIISNRQYDMYLLLAPDGIDHFNKQWRHFHAIQSFLEKSIIEYTVITGNDQEKLSRSIEIINKRFKISTNSLKNTLMV